MLKRNNQIGMVSQRVPRVSPPMYLERGVVYMTAPRVKFQVQRLLRET